MNRHLLAALFLVGFLLVSVPLLLMQPSGVANASLTAGFMIPIENRLHWLCLLSIGVVSAWLSREMIVQLPICGLLMLLLGMLVHVDSATFPEVRGFTLGAMLLFALSVSVMRHKISLISVVPVSAWAYFAGNSYMLVLEPGTQTLFFLEGIVMSAALLIAIGVALSITLTELLKNSLGKLKPVMALMSFLTLF